MSGRLPSRADFNQLQHLMVLLEQRSVSRAADRLGMGQPAMSRILARLRDQFDDPLLVRGPRGMMLTPRAEALRGPLGAWLREGESLIRDHGVDLGSMRRTFRLASTDFGVLSVIAPTLGLIEREAGGVELAVEPLSDASLRRLEDGRLDFVLTGWSPHGSSLKSRWLFQETHLGLARSDHAVHASSGSREDLLKWPHVTATVGDGFGDWIAEELPGLADRRVLISVESFSLTPYLLAETEAVAILPRRAAERFAATHDLRTFPAPVGIKPFDYHLVWHERSSDDQATRWIVETLAKAFEDETGAVQGRGNVISTTNPG